MEIDTGNFTFREIFNSRGNIIKNKTLIITKDAGNLIVKHSFDEIRKMKECVTVKGFRK